MTGKGPAQSLATLILAAHGSNGAPGSASVQAARLERRHLFRSVRAACLNGEPSLEDVLNAADGSVIIVPYLMSDGYTARSVLPRAIENSTFDLSRAGLAMPVGTSSLLPEIAAVQASALAAAKNWDLARTTIVVAAHGTPKNPRSGDTARELAAKLIERFPDCPASVGFLDDVPSIKEALEADARPKIVLGLFADEGPHGRRDVMRWIESADVEAVYGGALGALPEMADAILDVASRVRPISREMPKE